MLCIDEKSLQLTGLRRAPLPMSPGGIARRDCEYLRRDTGNPFVAGRPKAGAARSLGH